MFDTSKAKKKIATFRQFKLTFFTLDNSIQLGVSNRTGYMCNILFVFMFRVCKYAHFKFKFAICFQKAISLLATRSAFSI